MIEVDAYWRTYVPMQLRLTVAHKKLEILGARVEDLINTFERFEKELKPEERIAGIAQSISYLKSVYYEIINTAPSLHK